MIHVHFFSNVSHVRDKVPGTARNSGNAGGAVVHGFGNPCNRAGDFCHGSLKLRGFVVEFIHDIFDVGGVFPVLAGCLHKSLKFFENGLIYIIYQVLSAL